MMTPRRVRMPVEAERVIRILIVDSQAVVRTGLRMVIENESGMSVIGEASNRVDALVVAARECPDVILYEPGANIKESLELIPQLLSIAECAKVLVVTGETDPHLHEQVVLAGALGVVLKESAADVLAKAIVNIHSGYAWVSHSLMGTIISDIAKSRKLNFMDPESEKISALSKREKQIVELLAEGLKNKQIAERLSISEITVRHHLTSIFDELGISDRLELLIYAYKSGIARMQ